MFKRNSTNDTPNNSAKNNYEKAKSTPMDGHTSEKGARAKTFENKR
ncbi:hypothetical protein [Bacillus alkalicellulosilyticus]|nr:hypothetical protein [Bacillus alkalicellulosilyticus]